MDYLISLLQTSPTYIDGQPFVTADPFLLLIAIFFALLAVFVLLPRGPRK